MSENPKSPHVLNASSNLMGICFIVLTSLKVLHLSGNTFIDEFTMAPTVLFMTSSFFSYLSIRNTTGTHLAKFERIADLSFIIGLTMLFLLMLLLAFSFLS